MLDRDSFGPYLRHARERRSITLEDIAARTKISRSLLAKLERGDLSDWPPGIFRRSFFREYVSTIGLDPEALIDDFLRLFPDPAAGVNPEPERPAGDLRLTLDAVSSGPYFSWAGVRRAVVDTAAIGLAVFVISAVTGHAAVVAAVVALVYHAIARSMSGVWPVFARGNEAVPAPSDAASARARPELPRVGYRRPRLKHRVRVDSTVIHNVPRPS